jgi:hypothetical protein
MAILLAGAPPIPCEFFSRGFSSFILTHNLSQLGDPLTPNEDQSLEQISGPISAQMRGGVVLFWELLLSFAPMLASTDVIVNKALFFFF